jgi:V/A-type H+-transporting ATPase subunit I
MRPVPARWFEVLVANDDLVKAVEALARTGDVELEVYSESTQRVSMPNLKDQFESFDKLSRRYRRYWPQQALQPSQTPGRPEQRLDGALNKLAAWQKQADPVIDKLESLLRENHELNLIGEMFQHMSGDQLEFTHVGSAGPALGVRLFVLPVNAHIERLPPAVLSMRITTEQQQFLLVVGKQEAVSALQREMVVQKGQVVMMPAWLQGKLHYAQQQVADRLAEIDAQTQTIYGQLETLAAKHELHEVLGDIEQLGWFITHVTELPVTENFAWITGWTTDVSSDRISEVLEKEDLRAVVHYPPAPSGVTPPMVMHNPAWSRPFEFFARLLGVPSANEFDPSILLSVIVPLIFGYMFGDIGHGLVFFIAGLLLYRRWPLLKLFIICGLSSMMFGWVFGSIFGFEHIIEPLWVSPIQQPLTVLFVPLAGGVIVLVLGLLVNGVQQFWQGSLRQWFNIDAAVIVMYLGVIGGIVEPVVAALFPLGIAWYLAGNIATTREGYGKAVLHAIGQLLESVLQLLINTVSFIRVGAFALAHAGLSLAVIIMADAVDNIVLTAVLLLVGNVIILLLEGLVVSIQTTRLVLFEFFIRFLKGTGRLFQPLRAPTGMDGNKTRRISS